MFTLLTSILLLEVSGHCQNYHWSHNPGRNTALDGLAASMFQQRQD